MEPFLARPVFEKKYGQGTWRILKYLVLSFLPLASIPLISQTAGCVIDKNTNHPIPLVNIWVENEDIGTTTDNNGCFHFIDSLNNKYLIVTALGYERLRMKIDTPYLSVLLEPKVYSIPEVVIKPVKEEELQIITYRKSKLYNYISSLNPCIYARFIPYMEEYQNTPFIKSIKLETISWIESSRFRLRLFQVNPDGQPGEDILNNDLVVKVKKGRRSSLITDFNNTQIRFPKEGLFVALEFLIVKENEYEATFLDRETNKREKKVCYMPLFGTIMTEESPPLYVYTKGNWVLLKRKTCGGMSLTDKNECLAVEVTLTN
ncbi:MAG: carboxypeptidase-like regulatory domain-containing protein [Bacteroidales bacterium]